MVITTPVTFTLPGRFFLVPTLGWVDWAPKSTLVVFFQIRPAVYGTHDLVLEYLGGSHPC